MKLVRTRTVACEASLLGSRMKRMTLMKLRAALTISLVRDDSSRQMLCSSCSKVLTSMASGEREGHSEQESVQEGFFSRMLENHWSQRAHLYFQTLVELRPTRCR